MPLGDAGDRADHVHVNLMSYPTGVVLSMFDVLLNLQPLLLILG